MKRLGLIRVAAAMPRVHLADPAANAKEILGLCKQLAAQRPSVIVFPELSITGYTCADLFGQNRLLDDAERAVAEVVAKSAKQDALIVFGAPLRHAGRLFNCAVAARGGRILGIVPKTYLAGNGEFYEPRWFASARVLPLSGVRVRFAGQDDVLLGTRQLFRVGDALAAIEICQDLWVPVPPCSQAALAGAQLLLNLSASNEYLFKHEYRKSLVSATASRLYAAYIYCSCAEGESTQDLVWAGSSLICENGSVLAEGERFARGSRFIAADIDVERLETLRAKEHSFGFEGPVPAYVVQDAGEAADTDFEACLLRKLEPHPFVPQGDPEALGVRCREILAAQVAGLTTRLEHIRCRKAVIGVSGGLDSTLALLVTALAFDTLGIPRDGIIGVTMPGFGTTHRTHDNSVDLMRELGVTAREISIVPAVRQHFADIGQDESKHDLTYENSQARERTQLLMDVAGKEGGIVVGTGDLSELALGWCTYNADHMSMYGVNASVPKTLVRTLVRWAADNKFGGNGDIHATLLDIVDTPISPELLPADKDGKIAQKTEDTVGPYELHDFFLYHFFRSGADPDKLLFLARKAFAGSYDDATLRKWLETFLKRFFNQQFKRSCLPDGPKVGSVSLSPRGDWRMPSDLESCWKLSD
ncbi:MAG: NAD(+) synthase [Bacteroidales bacterium]|nr:NAD(+) synthase [Bacteroidales bacterium]